MNNGIKDTYNITFDDVIYFIKNRLSKEIDMADVTQIIGIARGGLVPATIISNIYNIPLSIIEHSSFKGKGSGKEFIYENIKYSYGTALIVDDIIDTGNTMEEIYNHLSNNYPDIIKRNYCHVLKSPTSAVKDIFCCGIADERWVIFPWE